MNNLKKILEKEGIKIKDLALGSGISTTTLSNVASGKKNPSLTNQNRIVNAINKVTDQAYYLIEIFPKIGDNTSGKLKMERVFKRGGVPTTTFVKPAEYDRLLISLRDPGRCLIVQGPSGVGKTSAVKKLLEELNLDQYTEYYTARDTDDLITIKKIALGEKKGFFIIDDFHRLTDEIKQNLTDRIKIIADIGNETEKIVILGINKVERSLYSFSPDLIGRIDIVIFESNPHEKLMELIKRGEEALNITFLNKEELIHEATGSFHLLQSICYEACLNDKIFEAQIEKIKIDVNIHSLRNLIAKSLDGNYYQLTKEIAQGTKLNSAGRAPYLHLLKHLSMVSDWSFSLNDYEKIYPNHYAIIDSLDKAGAIIRHINQEKFDKLIYFDETSRTISAEDAKFVYYLRSFGDWKSFSERIGYPKNVLNIDKKYDIALSFAGEDRILAETIFKELLAENIAVFYDKNNQSAIIGQDVKVYLGKTYREKSILIVPLISKNYPEKIWTIFEAEEFEHKIEDNTILPVFIDGYVPGVFDKLKDIGRLTFDNDLDFDKQVIDICTTIKGKIIEKRYAINE